MKCEVPGCLHDIKYSHPGNWCQKHWSQWWEYGLKGKKELDWMKNPLSRTIK
jgi:hypothetical protein